MTAEIVGHTRILSQLDKAIESGNLHSTLLFAGPEGIGKRLVARRLARALLCDNRVGGSSCGRCRSCALIDSGNHPDFVFVDLNEKDAGKVEGIRDILGAIQVKPYMQNGRVVIFDNAHAMTLAASNILLKTFEEPQKGNTFIVISSNPSRLPITLRSRCQVWGFASLNTAELSEILARKLSLKDISDEIVLLSDGSIGNATMLLEHHDLLSDVKEILRKLAKGDVGFFYEDLTAWVKQKEDIPRVLHVTRLLARHYLLTVKDPEEKALWAMFLEDLNSAEWAIAERNLSPLLVLLNVFLRLVPDKTRGHSFTRIALNDTLGQLIRI